MGSIQVSHVGWRRPGGAELLRDVNFTVGNGDRVALVGANGVGKSTLLRLIAGETTPTTGTISIDGRLGVMRQLVGDNEQTVRDLMVSLAPQRLQDAAARVARAEASAGEDPMRYATALAEWGDARGYDAEVFWDACCTKAIGEPFADLERRPLRTFSGGEQKRLALEALLRSDYEELARNRSYFGEFDPFGDFDLIFGAAKHNLKIIEVPIKYRARTFGETQISRFRDGWLLLKMVWFAYRKLKAV